MEQLVYIFVGIVLVSVLDLAYTKHVVKKSIEAKHREVAAHVDKQFNDFDEKLYSCKKEINKFKEDQTMMDTKQMRNQVLQMMQVRHNLSRIPEVAKVAVDGLISSVRTDTIDECLESVEWDGYTIDIKHKLESLKHPISADKMDFPETVEEFMEQYKMVDRKEIYSNGTEYVPIFRMKQWFDDNPKSEYQRGRESALREVLLNIDLGVDATGHSDEYCTGMCNALIWLKSCILHKEPQFVTCSKEGV